MTNTKAKLSTSNKLAALASAFLLAAIPLANQQAAAAPGMKTFSVAFYYNGAEAAPAILADIRRTARKACAGNSQLRVVHMFSTQRACAVDLTGKAVEKIGRPDLIAFHEGRGRGSPVITTTY